MVTRTTKQEPAATPGDGAPPATPLENLADQAQDLIAESGDGGQPPGQGVELAMPPAPPPPPTNSQVCTGIFKTVRETVSIVASLESPRRVLTDDICAQLGALWGECADAFGINMHGQLGTWAPLFGAIVGSVGLLGPAVSEIRKEIAEKDRARPVNTTAKPVAATPAASSAPAIDPGSSGTIKPAFAQ